MSEAPVPPERIVARTSSLGEGMTVARVLLTRGRRMIGAWCFLDHLGPVDFPAGQGMHVGAHPHTRLQTFTWMIEGEILHRDSLGSEQVVRPGQVNLMTAGYGIRTPKTRSHPVHACMRPSCGLPCRRRWPTSRPPLRITRCCPPGRRRVATGP